MDSTIKKNSNKHTNDLIHESSPYLLQHAHNPVNWKAWNDKTLKQAEKENKIILISIGYSACHWCHVMEHESFEDEEVAKLMNKYFVCIKVDREERPDIDQIYMDAVQLITGSGGWPLNCFALPSGKPFYGGTYFPKHQWKQVLKGLHNEWENNPEKIIEHAENLTEGLQNMENLVKVDYEDVFSADVLHTMVNRWKNHFDNEDGGGDRLPKFPLPNNYEFLLYYSTIYNTIEVEQHTYLTLNKMARGGIYDQVGGGFARYSTDAYWKVPHFEKMLYDNAQLVSLYAKAYLKTKNSLYKHVVNHTLNFVKTNLTDKTGAFYSAIDADSEREEGKYYVWNEDEIKRVLGKNINFASDLYLLNNKAKWEGNYILMRNLSDKELLQKYKLTEKELYDKIAVVNNRLLEVRKARVQPGLDDKSLTSWNALMLKGYVDAYFAFNNKDYLNQAINNANFILQHQLQPDGKLYHNYKNGKSLINGFLEDYAFTIESFIALYEATFNEKWLKKANDLTKYTIKHFYDNSTGMFFFTSNLDSALITRKKEINDNVIPASNSSMAKCLFLLSNYLDNSDYDAMAKQMLKNVENLIAKYGSGYSNWGILMLTYTSSFYQIAITGNKALELNKEINSYYIPNKVIMGTKLESSLPLLTHKYVKDKNLIYVCKNKVCESPCTTTEEVLKKVK